MPNFFSYSSKKDLRSAAAWAPPEALTTMRGGFAGAAWPRAVVDAPVAASAAEPARTPEAEDLADDELVRLLDAADSREILHVTYGAVWAALGADLRRAVWSGRDAYTGALAAHLGRHLAAVSPAG
jgi:hypothetical protein